MNDRPWMEKGIAAGLDNDPPAPAPKEPQSKPAPEAVLVPMDTVEPVPVSWLWRHWLPLGTLAVLDGDPGMGKSTLTLDLTARVTQGWDMPPGGGGHEEPGSVLLLSAEDNPGHTIRPRLDAANADASRVHFLASVRQGADSRPPVLPWDLPLVEEHARRHGVLLVVADPFTAFLAPEFDSKSDHDIRRCLHVIAEFAEQVGVCFLLVRHLNKLSGGPALYRGGGSIAITGAARASLVVGRDPDDPDRHVLAMNKSNLGPMPPSRPYRIEQAGPGVTRIAWEEEDSDLAPADILWHAQGRTPARPDDPVAEAGKFLSSLLANGPVAVTDIEADCREAGYAWATVRRAKGKIQVFAFKQLSRWYWKLAEAHDRK